MKKRRFPSPKPGVRINDITLVKEIPPTSPKGASRWETICEIGHKRTLGLKSIQSQGCTPCRKAKKITGCGAIGAKLVKQELDALSPVNREAVQQLVARNREARQAIGIRISSAEQQRIWLEAIESVKLGDHLTLDDTNNDDIRLKTEYSQYKSPPDIRI